jgi:hypothetical protein
MIADRDGTGRTEATWRVRESWYWMPEKTQHVLDELPQHRHALRQRMLVDGEFRSLCEDYGDAFEALRRWEASADVHRAARVEEFGRLLAELESEILTELGVR